MYNCAVVLNVAKNYGISQDCVKSVFSHAPQPAGRNETFISKEQILSKTGGSNDASHGFAGNWHIPLHEKLEAGNILTGLTIQEKQSSGPGKGYDLIELHIPTQDEDFLPNFRTGDMVILYAYKEEPDMRKQILMKGNILELQPDRMTLVLRNGQQNKDIIGGKEEVFAVEHDFSDTSANNGFRGLYAFLSAQADRKELLLGVRPPAQLEGVKLNGDYGRFNELILKEKQAKDYFLLVGPPGTGKTSCALRFMVEEALSEPDTSILLLSYTNRAVDEICAMLTDSGIADRTPFIRIGNELSCDKRFVPYLLKYSLDDCPKLTDIQQKLDTLHTLNEQLPDPQLSAAMTRMEKAGRSIVEAVEANPEKAKQVRRFANYYLPDAVNVLQQYAKLAKQGVRGENAAAIRTEVEHNAASIATAFENQLDALYAAESMDLSADITVLQNMLKGQGLS